MTAAPYAPETRAKGWRFELDLEQISQSDTWVLASPDLRPWLLMLWSISWQQVPCGSLPAEDTIIAARIGMKPGVFAKHRHVLLRGWYAADDGRLYHPTITRRVLAMLETKQKEKDRKAAYRAKMSGNVPRDTTGTTTGQPPDGRGSDPGRDATGTGTGTGTGIKTGGNRHSLQDSTVVGADAPPPRVESTRPGEIAKLIRDQGVQATPGNPLVQTWANGMSVTDDELVEAIARAREQKPAPEKIPVKYLDAVLQGMRREGTGPPRHPAPDGAQRLGKAGRETAAAAQRWLEKSGGEA